MSQISGGEAIPDLVISPTSGVIDPLQMTRVSLTFEANNAGVWNKKMLKLEVSDVGNILNQATPVSVMVNVEAYNVAVDVIYLAIYFSDMFFS